MKISNIYVEPKFGIKNKYVAKTAKHINKRIMESIGTTAFTEKDKDNIIQHFKRELDSCSPDIRDNLRIWDVPVEFSNLSEITATESGIIEYKDNDSLLICDWYLADIDGIPEYLPPSSLEALQETLTAEYIGVCDDIYKAIKDKSPIIFYDGYKDLKSLRKTSGRKYRIYGNGKPKAIVYTPDGWD